MVKIDLNLRQYLENDVSVDHSDEEFLKNIESYEKKDFVDYFKQERAEQQKSEENLESESKEEGSDLDDFK